MDSRIIDVALGLALVFALTSLLATAMAEAVLSKFNLRAKNLRLAVASMFGEDNNKTTPMSERLYKMPLIESLYQIKREPAPWDKAQALIFGESGPSYLEPGMFVGAFLDVLAETAGTHLRQGQATPQEFIAALLAGTSAAATTNPPPSQQLPASFAATCQALQLLSRGCERDWPAFEQRIKAWFEATAERSTGWFTRQTQTLLFLIGVLLAASLNINPIVIAQALWRDPVLRESVAQTAIRVDAEHRGAQAASAGSAATPTPAARPAAKTLPPGELTNKEITKLFDLLADPLTEASGQARIQVSRFREAADFERNLAKQEPPHADAIRDQRKRVDHRLDTLAHDIETLKSHDRDELQQQIEQVRAALKSERSIAGPHPVPQPKTTGSSCPSGAEVLGKEGNNALTQLCALGIPMGWNADFDIPDAFGAFWPNFLAMILGFLITGVACTLGAQFWFDTLSKIVKLRGTGGKPASPGEGDGTDPTRSPANGWTPSSPGGGAPAGGGREPFASYLNDAEQALRGDRVKTQQVQRNLGMPNGKITGQLDGETRAAIKAWHQKNNRDGLDQLSSDDIIELTRD